MLPEIEELALYYQNPHKRNAMWTIHIYREAEMTYEGNCGCIEFTNVKQAIHVLKVMKKEAFKDDILGSVRRLRGKNRIEYEFVANDNDLDDFTAFVLYLELTPIFNPFANLDEKYIKSIYGYSINSLIK